LGNEIYVLKGIDLEIKQRRICSINVPSGSGKINFNEFIRLPGYTNFRELHSERKRRQPNEDDELAEIRNKEMDSVFQTFNLYQELPR
jgi:ABC-type lipoprotein export system ATPase subunit